MTSTILLNLVVSTGAVGLLITVLRAAYLAAGGRLEEVPAEADGDTPYELERAA
jgi:hypothetical protein